MSATFRLSKKKIAQTDLRRLMTDHKEKLQLQKVTKQIDSPLAKYNEIGQLMCLLCKSIVRSENVWSVHINTKQHKDNIESAKRLKANTQNFTATPKEVASTLKRPASPQSSGQNKRIKGILKNSQSVANIPQDFFDLGSGSALKNEASSNLDSDKRIETKNNSTALSKDEVPESSETEPLENPEAEEVLPEGFFDDPVMDAKARNVQYKDPIEEEWEKFQKEMKEETSVSAAIIAGEHEEAIAERQIDEIDEQIRNWSRVLDLERKKEEAKNQKDLENTAAMDCDRPSSDDEDDFDEYLDWRAKKSFR